MVGDPRVPAQKDFLYLLSIMFYAQAWWLVTPAFYAQSWWLVTPESLRRRSFLIRPRLFFMHGRGDW